MKHRKMKMIVAAVLAAGMILGLAACGGSQTQPDDAQDAAETQAAPETQAPAETQAAPETQPAAPETETAPAPDSGDHSGQAAALPLFRYDELYGGTDRFDSLEAAAYDYLALEKNEDHDPDHVMIPYVAIVAVEDSAASDVLIYGDYYLWEFAQEGDVLAAVSGGHCPGIIHAEMFGKGETATYSATEMNEAFTDSDVAALFGDHLDAYHAVVSDDQARDAAIAQVIADYVRVNALDVTRYQFGDGEQHDLP